MLRDEEEIVEILKMSTEMRRMVSSFRICVGDAVCERTSYVI